VDFELSADQRALDAAARRLLDQRSTPQRLRALAAEAGPTIDRELWAAMADQGWPAVPLPERFGGLGLGMVELCLLLEAVGRRVAAVPLAGTALVAWALADAVDRNEVDPEAPLGSETVGSWIGRLGRGDAVGALAWCVGSAAAVAHDPPGSAGRSLVAFGPVADLVVVIGGPGPTALAVALGPGSRPADEPVVDVTRTFGWFDPGRSGDGRGEAITVATGPTAWQVADRAATAAAAELLGQADWALSTTARYAGDRVQFGQPIGAFQAVKHRCADMVVDVEGMRSVVAYASWTVGQRPPGDADAAVAASAAKLWCSEATGRVMASALQVHGGIGFTWDHDLHLYVKRSLLDQLAMGDARWHRDRLAQLLRRRVEAGLPVL
jgi:alkylation response protein AidB-like acyl-CoA dehydrogenase